MSRRYHVKRSHLPQSSPSDISLLDIQSSAIVREGKKIPLTAIWHLRTKYGTRYNCHWSWTFGRIQWTRGLPQSNHSLIYRDLYFLHAWWALMVLLSWYSLGHFEALHALNIWRLATYSEGKNIYFKSAPIDIQLDTHRAFRNHAVTSCF